jgi:dihydroorotate dehydrogenase electron transfer subunit
VLRVIEAAVSEINHFPHGNCIIAVEDSELGSLALPGQFVMAAAATIETVPHPLLKRALAIYRTGHTIGNKPAVFFLIKVVGEGTRQLTALRSGDQLELIGPLGNGFDLEKARSRINFLVVGGTGIASVYLLAEHLRRYGEEVHLVYGGRTADDLVGLDDFERLEVPIVVATDDGSRGFHGLATDAFYDYLNGFPADKANVYTCGPNPMMQAIAEFSNSAAIPCQISVESKMGCGFGVCLGCSVMTKDSNRLACTDGPVFEASEFVWESDMKGAESGL